MFGATTSPGGDPTPESPPGRAPDPPGKIIVQIILGVGIIILAIADLYIGNDVSVSPIVYGILGAIAGGPELLRLVRGGGT